MSGDTLAQMGSDFTSEAEIFCICESASVEDGCLNIQKTFSRLLGRSFPVSRTITIALRVRFEADNEGTHQVRVSIFDLDDRLVGSPASGETDAASIGNDVHSWIQAIV